MPKYIKPIVTARTAGSTIRRSMPNLRAEIIKEMKRQKCSTYKLVEMLKGKRDGGADVPKQTVYRFISGKSPINSDDAGLILDVLGIDLNRPK